MTDHDSKAIERTIGGDDCPQPWEPPIDEALAKPSTTPDVAELMAIGEGLPKGPWAFSPKDTNISREIVSADGIDICNVWNFEKLRTASDVGRRCAAAIISLPRLFEALASLSAQLAVKNAALTLARGALRDPVVGTIYHDDPDWYRKVDVAVDAIDAALSPQADAATGDK